MKKLLLHSFTAIFLLLSPVNFSQEDYNPCKYFHSEHCKFARGFNYYYSGYSRSGEFVKGQESEFSMIALGNRDYHFSLCSHRKLGDIQLIVTDESKNNILYDNAEEEFAKMFIVTIDTMQTIWVKVIVPGEEEESEKRKQKEKPRCVGLLIEYATIKKQGFGF